MPTVAVINSELSDLIFVPGMVIDVTFSIELIEEWANFVALLHGGFFLEDKVIYVDIFGFPDREVMQIFDVGALTGL